MTEKEFLDSLNVETVVITKSEYDRLTEGRVEND